MHTDSRAVTRSGRPFVGRQDLIRLFCDALRKHQQQVETSEADIRPRVLNFWGVSGIGKSELLAQLKREARDEFSGAVFAGVEFRPDMATEIDLALRSIRHKAKEKHHIDFPTFDIASAICWKVTRPDFALQKSDLPFLDEAGLAGDLLQIVADLPVVQWLPKFTKAGVKLSKAAKQWWAKRGQRELTGLPNMRRDEILERLPHFLAIDLEAHRRKADVKTPLVIYFDAYELLWGDRRKPSNIFYEDDWIRELIKKLPSALFVISGQQPLRWHEKWPEWVDLIDSHELKELTDERVEEFLTGSGVAEAEIRERIASGSRGVPFYLELSVDTYLDTIRRGETPNADQFGGTFYEIFYRFLRNLKECEQHALKVLSAARSWDMPLAEKMLSRFVSSFPLAQLDEFHKFSFVKRDPTTGRYLLHDLMRFHLTEAQEFAEFHQNTMHPWLFEHYDGMLKEIDIKNITERHRLAFAEAFFHAGETLTALQLYNWTTDLTNALYQAAEWALLVPVYETLIERLTGLKGEGETELATTLNNLAELYRNQGKYDLAEPLYKQALEIRRTALGETHPDFASSLNNLAGLYQSQGKYDLAEPLHKQALEIRRTALGETHPDFAQSLNNLANLYYSQGKYDLAEPLYKQALEIDKEALGENHPRYGTYLNNLAGLYRRQGKCDLAEPLYKQALEILEKTFGAIHPNIATTHENLSGLYSEMSDRAKAAEHKEKAEAIRAVLARGSASQ